MELDLNDIKYELNREFAKDSARLIFWYDDNAEYEEDISELELDNATVFMLEKSRYFYAKYFLNSEDKEGKYLIYAPFPKPSDDENPLADMCWYSAVFYSDKVSQLCKKMNIDLKFKNHMGDFPQYWKSKERLSAFMNIAVDDYNVETINIAMIAALVGVKTASFEEIIKQLIITGNYSKSVMFSKITKMGLEPVFWELCDKFYKYNSDKPDLSEFVIALLLTNATFTLKESTPSSFTGYLKLIEKKNDAIVLVRNIMDNTVYSEKYDKLASAVSDKLKIPEKLRSANMSNILTSDSFEVFDEMIINWITDKLENNMLDEKINDNSVDAICNMRMSRISHYSSKYSEEYKILKSAYHMLKMISLYENAQTLKEMADSYANKDYLIDTQYRLFYCALDKSKKYDRFSGLQEQVENTYANIYLSKSVPQWNMFLTDECRTDAKFVSQNRFFRTYLNEYVGGDRVIVIISDAFRYECAMEMLKIIEMDEKCEGKIEYMLGVLPSVTELGMASLLPNENISVDSDLKVLVDGENCGTTELRDKILKKKAENNLCIRFDELKNADRYKIRELLQGRNIIYVYHNQVDARGDKSASENEVFTACVEAIDEIHQLIRDLTERVSATKFIVTADHGFLYKHKKIAEYDKVSVKSDETIQVSKRFILSNNIISVDGAITRNTSYLGNNILSVATPVGADIFKAPGGGQNYVHGGSSMQEMIIPVLEVRTAKGAKKTGYVDIVLTSTTRKVTNLVSFFEFIQTEKVTDTAKARNVVAFFTTEDGEKISFDVPIVADIKDDSAKNRTFREKFTLKTREYKRIDKYYLVIADTANEKTILQQYEFMIDIAFANDFGF